MMSYAAHFNKNSSVGRYINTLPPYKEKTLEEELELGRKVKNGDLAALEETITSNLHLVVHLSKKFYNRHVLQEDLIAVGNIGLIKAAKKYDPEERVRFSTFAAWEIKNAMRKEIARHERTVRLPPSARDKASKLLKLSLIMEESLARPATAEELSEATGISTSKIKFLLSSAQPAKSMGEYIIDYNGELQLLEDTIPDEQPPIPGQESEDSETLIYALEYLGNSGELGPIRVQVIKDRFGLKGREQKTFQEIGKKLGIKFQVAQQHEGNALQIMREGLNQECTPYARMKRRGELISPALAVSI